MSRPNAYNRIGEPIEHNGRKRQLVSSNKMWGLQHNGEWITETRYPSWIGGGIKYIKCFYPNVKAAETQKNKYLKRFGLHCEVVQLPTGGQQDGENE